MSNKTFVSIYTTCNLVISNRWKSSVQILLYKISVDAIPPFHRNSPAFSPVSSIKVQRLIEKKKGRNNWSLVKWHEI